MESILRCDLVVEAGPDIDYVTVQAFQPPANQVSGNILPHIDTDIQLSLSHYTHTSQASLNKIRSSI